MLGRLTKEKKREGSKQEPLLLIPHRYKWSWDTVNNYASTN